MNGLVIIIIWAVIGWVMSQMGKSQEDDNDMEFEDLDLLLKSKPRQKQKPKSAPRQRPRQAPHPEKQVGTVLGESTKWDERFQQRRRQASRKQRENEDAVRSIERAAEAQRPVQDVDSLSEHRGESVPQHVDEMREHRSQFQKEVLHHTQVKDGIKRSTAFGGKVAKLAKMSKAGSVAKRRRRKKPVRRVRKRKKVPGPSVLVPSMLRKPEALKSAFLLSEILGLPRGVQPYGESGYAEQHLR